MSATKILWGQIVVVFPIVLATMWGATEWTAWRLGFQPELGPPWFELAALAGLSAARLLLVVVPLRRLCAADLRRGRAISPPPAALISIVIAIGMSVWRAREAKNAETYGSARWADREEIQAAGPARRRRRRARPARRVTIFATTGRSMCSASRRPGQRQGRRPGRADAAHLAGLGHRP